MPQPAPEYHYYRAPYSILSFIAGLYCDKNWSDEEFKKWEASKDPVTGDYTYYRYLDPYQPFPATATAVIGDKVWRDSRNVPDASRRRAPNRDNCLEVWPGLVKELCLAAQPPASGRLPLFYDQKPILSTLAAIYLGDDISAKQAFAFLERDGQVNALTQFKQLAEVKGSAAAEAILSSLKELILTDLIDPPNCW